MNYEVIFVIDNNKALLKYLGEIYFAIFTNVIFQILVIRVSDGELNIVG